MVSAKWAHHGVMIEYFIEQQREGERKRRNREKEKALFEFFT